MAPSIVPTLRRFGELRWPDRLCLVEAAATLAVASVAVALLPFRTVARHADRRPSRSVALRDREEEIARIRWAIEACARRLPWRIVCIQKGLTMHSMLRRRGIPSLLHYGVAREENHDLKAHVWVTDGKTDLIGGPEAKGFTLIATFPAPDAR